MQRKEFFRVAKITGENAYEFRKMSLTNINCTGIKTDYMGIQKYYRIDQYFNELQAIPKDHTLYKGIT